MISIINHMIHELTEWLIEWLLQWTSMNRPGVLTISFSRKHRGQSPARQHLSHQICLSQQINTSPGYTEPIESSEIPWIIHASNKWQDCAPTPACNAQIVITILSDCNHKQNASGKFDKISGSKKYKRNASCAVATSKDLAIWRFPWNVLGDFHPRSISVVALGVRHLV